MNILLHSTDLPSHQIRFQPSVSFIQRISSSMSMAYECGPVSILAQPLPPIYHQVWMQLTSLYITLQLHAGICWLTQINWGKMIPVTFTSMKQINLKQLWASQKQPILQENSSISKYLTKKLGKSIPTVLCIMPTNGAGQPLLSIDGSKIHASLPANSSHLRMLIFHITETAQSWRIPAPPPTPHHHRILSCIIAWAITTDTFCETIFLMFKGLFLKKGNKRALGACCTDSRKCRFAALFDLDFITCEDWEGNWLDFFFLSARQMVVLSKQASNPKELSPSVTIKLKKKKPKERHDHV